ncbi:MAG: S-adenosylmethionine:tRNA ribosyltransferase-isomerase [Candidatus Malihini olakiniferum]
MRVSDFSFELPEAIIAHYPQAQRLPVAVAGRFQREPVTHGFFTDLLEKLVPGDLLVFNNTRVIPAVYSAKKSVVIRLSCWVRTAA